MADTKKAPETVEESDRVAMVSFRSDGTPDQNNPVIIIDKDAAIEATAGQLAQQETDGDAKKAAAAAEKRATSVVNSLHEG